MLLAVPTSVGVPPTSVAFDDEVGSPEMVALIEAVGTPLTLPTSVGVVPTSVAFDETVGPPEMVAFVGDVGKPLTVPTSVGVPLDSLALDEAVGKPAVVEFSPKPSPLVGVGKVDPADVPNSELGGLVSVELEVPLADADIPELGKPEAEVQSTVVVVVSTSSTVGEVVSESRSTIVMTLICAEVSLSDGTCVTSLLE